MFLVLASTIPTTWGLWRQHKTIRDGNSGQSVSVTRFSCSFFLFAAIFIYGLTKQTRLEQASLIFVGLSRSIFMALVLWDLWKFKEFTKLEQRLQKTLLLILAAMLFLPQKDKFLMFFQGTSLVAFATQPWEIWRNEKSGAVEIRLLYINLLASLFWGIYGFVFRDRPIMIMSPLLFLTVLITILLWYKYRKPDTP